MEHNRVSQQVSQDKTSKRKNPKSDVYGIRELQLHERKVAEKIAAAIKSLQIAERNCQVAHSVVNQRTLVSYLEDEVTRTHTELAQLQEKQAQIQGRQESLEQTRQEALVEAQEEDQEHIRQEILEQTRQEDLARALAVSEVAQSRASFPNSQLPTALPVEVAEQTSSRQEVIDWSLLAKNQGGYLNDLSGASEVGGWPSLSALPCKKIVGTGHGPKRKTSNSTQVAGAQNVESGSSESDRVWEAQDAMQLYPQKIQDYANLLSMPTDSEGRAAILAAAHADRFTERQIQQFMHPKPANNIAKKIRQNQIFKRH